MASEKITMYRTNEDQTVVIEQLPKTVTSQVYDSENEQFLDTTIEDINTEITEHKQQKGQPNGYASLDANGKVPSSQISISGGGVVEDASTTQKGIVKLNTSTNSTSTTEAATPSSVKTTYDLANSKYTKPQTGIPSSDLTNDVQATLNKVVDGNTTTKGIVQLTNSTSSTSTTTAATPSSVKTAYDLANGKYNKPTNGIPASDLTSDVQATLNKVVDGTTSTKGIVQLTDSFTSGSTTTAATPSSVKIVADALVSHNDDYLKHGITGTTTGSANTYVLTPSPALSTYTKGIRITLFVNVANTGSSTINISGLGTKTLKKNDGSTYASGELKINTPYTFVYNGADFLADSLGGGGISEEVIVEYVDFSNRATIPSYYTDSLSLTVARRKLAATTVGNYALFGGGIATSVSNVVDAFDGDGVRTTPTSLSVGRGYLDATTVGNYALFGGGRTANGQSAAVDAYNSLGTRTTPTALSLVRHALTTTTVGNYALFGGGASLDNTGLTNVDAYNSSLVRTTPTSLSVGRGYLDATTVGNYALFGGGFELNAGRNTVDVYNTSLTRSTAANLSIARDELAATTVGNYALFGGGVSYINGEEARAEVDVYTDSLVKLTLQYLTNPASELAGVSLSHYAVFGGGSMTETNSTSVVDVFNNYLIKTTIDNLSLARNALCALSINKYIIFGGGRTANGQNSSVVDVYSYEIATNIHITSGSKYKFNNDTEQTATSNLNLFFDSAVNGYVKVKSGTLTRI